MKKNLVMVSLWAFALLSCKGEKQEIKEKYCGVEMTGYEVMDYKTMGNKGYTYSDADKALHSKLTDTLNKMFKDEHDIVVSFAYKDNDKMALYIVAPDDKAIVEKISCYLLQTRIEGMPTNKNVMFYTEDHNTLVAAVKTKKI